MTVIGHSSGKERAIETLQSLGSVQVLDISDSEQPLQGPGSGASSSGEIDAALQEIAFSTSFLDRFQVRQKSLLDSFIGSKVTLDADKYQQTVAFFDYHDVYRKCSMIDSRLAEIRNTRARLLSQKDTLPPWVDLDVPAQDLGGTETTDITLGSMTAREYEAMEQAIRDSGRALDVWPVSRDLRQVYFLLAVIKDDREALDVVRPFPINKVSVGELTGSVRMALAEIETGLSRLDSEEGGLVAEAKGLLHHYDELLALHDELMATRARFAVQGNFARTEQVFALQGWARTAEADTLRRALEGSSALLQVSFADPGPGETPPVVLENSRLIEPFEMVTTIYGLPSYNETDPTPLLAPFFFVFFGLALSDAAYGLLLMILSLYAIKKFDMPWSQKKLFRLLAMCGISTVVFGALLGSWFGNLYDILPPSLGFLRTFRDALFWFDPLADPLRMLIISLALGIVQVWFGIAIKMRATIRRSGLVTGLLDQGTWLFLLGSLIFMVLAQAGIVPKTLSSLAGRMAQVGALLVVAAQGRNAKSWIAKPFAGLYGLYSIIGYFSDVLSYARLLALGLATGVIANVVNQMATLVQPIPLLGPVLMLPVLVGGHMFNFVINILGSFIHSGRLQFVEFFTKFFEGGGKTFKPFRRDNKYTAIRHHVVG
ncbi:MAG: V-type ATP synthase subunit I [Bacillota bacterium]|nr:V-type ATP synthase subunit I [Bacillota bacterium]